MLKAHRDPKEHKELVVLKEDLWVPQEHKEHKEHKVPQERKVLS